MQNMFFLVRVMYNHKRDFRLAILLISLFSLSHVQAQSFYGYPSYEESAQSFQPFAFFGAEPLWEDFRNYEEHQIFGQIGSAVGQLETILEVDGKRISGAYGCTATLIAEDIIITNYHCVPNRESRIKLINAFLRMDFLSLGDSGDIYPVDIRVLESSEALDYAILRVENSPGRIYGFVPLRYRSATETDELFMIHHSKAKPKQITRRNCTMLKTSQIEQLPIEMVGEFRSFNIESDRPHRCDSEEGSSGALVFAYSDGAVVGLHFAGTSSKLPVQQRANIFVDMTALVEQSTQLRSLAERAMGTSQSPSSTPNAGSGLSSQISMIEETSSTDSAAKPRPAVTANSGFLNLVTTPNGANVFINQEFLGKTPIEQFPLTRGRYDLRISYEGYDSLDGYFQIIAGQSTDGKIELVAQEGTVVEDSVSAASTDSSTTDSTATTDSSDAITPFPTTAPNNPANPTAADGSAILGRENFGSITVYSEPIGAEVFVNDRLIGLTPLIAFALDLGVYDIALSKDGYQIYQDKASIARSRNTDVTVRLVEASTEVGTEVTLTDEASTNEANSISESNSSNIGDTQAGDIQTEEIPSSPNVTSGTGETQADIAQPNFGEETKTQTETQSQTSPVSFASPDSDNSRLITSTEEFIRLARTGGVLRLGEGRFDVNGALSLSNDLEIIGAGADKTIIVSSAEGYVLRLSNMRFKATDVSVQHTSGQWANVIVAHDSQVDIQGASVSGAVWDRTINQGGMGLWLSGSSSGKIFQSTFENNQLHGIYVSETSEPILERNLVRNNGQNGLLFLGNSSGIATSNVLEDNGLHGISVGGQARPSLENNSLRGNGETGITYFDSATGISFANLSEGNGSYGISVVGRSEPRVEQNTLRSNTKTGLFYAGDSGGVAKGNLISANQVNGITINDNAQLELTDNRIDGNFWYGVYFDGNRQLDLSNNIIENNRAGRSNR